MTERRSETKGSYIVIHDTPISLVQMASTKIAIALWYHKAIRYDESSSSYYDKTNKVYESRDRQYDSDDSDYEIVDGDTYKFHESQSLIKTVKNLLEQLPAPRAVRQIIGDFISQINDEVIKWIIYHQKRVFFGIPKTHCYALIDDFVWKCNGTVDYLETAKNLLSSLSLSEVEKYRVRCIYCLEDEMKNVPPSLFTNRHRIGVSFTDCPLIYYWNCYMMGELGMIAQDGFRSVYGRLITMKNVDNEWATKYLWNHLVEDEKVEIAKRLIREYGVKHQTFLLNHLTELQQHSLFLEMAADIVKNFILECKWPVIISVLKIVWNLVSREQLVDILQELCQYRMSNYSADFFAVIKYIWDNFTSDFKYFAVTVKNGIFVSSVMKLCSLAEDDILEDFVKLLIEVSHVARNAIEDSEIMESHYALKFFSHLLQRGRLTLLDRFIRTYFSTDEYLLDYRKEIFHSANIKTALLIHMNPEGISTLNDILKFYSFDPNFVAEYKADLFFEYDGYYNWLDNVDNENVDVKLVCAFLTDALSGLDVAKRRVLIAESRYLCVKVLRLGTAVLKHLFNLCLCNDDAIEFKKRMLKDYPNDVINHLFKLDYNSNSEELNDFFDYFFFMPQLSDDCIGDFVDYFLRRRLRRGYSPSILLVLLTKVSENARKEILYRKSCREICKELARAGHLTALDRLLTGCLSNDDVAKFKEDVIRDEHQSDE